MKLYKITMLDNDSNRFVVSWTTSEGDASKIKTAAKKADKTAEPEFEAVEVPTTRTELVAFLNELANDASPFKSKAAEG